MNAIVIDHKAADMLVVRTILNVIIITHITH